MLGSGIVKSYARWMDRMAIDVQVDPAASQVLTFTKDCVRELSDWLRANDELFAQMAEDWAEGQFATFRIGASGVAKGYIVALSEGTVVPARLSDATKVPIAVVKKVMADSHGDLWARVGLAPHVTEMKTVDALIAPGSALYLSTTDGQCSSMTAQLDGATVQYSIMVGRSIESVSNGMVKAVWSPGIPFQLG